MKLRIEGQTIRYRLSADDLKKFDTHDKLENRVYLTGDQSFTYILEKKESGEIEISFQNNTMTIRVSSMEVNDWINSKRVGLESSLDAGGSVLQIIIEKDLKPKRERKIDAG